MKKDLIDILCCPTCKGELSLTITKENDGEIIEGSFTCKTCTHVYPIKDGIPNFLPQE
jgi:uncharacterized protein YbaR (Trm112 family)